MTRKHTWGTLCYYAVAVLLALIALVPFFWMISTSLKSRGALMSIPIEWIPAEPTLDAYTTVFERFPFFSNHPQQPVYFRELYGDHAVFRLAGGIRLHKNTV